MTSHWAGHRRQLPPTSAGLQPKDLKLGSHSIGRSTKSSPSAADAVWSSCWHFSTADPGAWSITHYRQRDGKISEHAVRRTVARGQPTTDSFGPLKYLFSAPKLQHMLLSAPCNHNPLLESFDNILRSTVCAIMQHHTYRRPVDPGQYISSR